MVVVFVEVVFVVKEESLIIEVAFELLVKDDEVFAVVFVVDVEVAIEKVVDVDAFVNTVVFVVVDDVVCEVV